MSKLYFRYGTVGSAKTLNLLAVAHTYQMQDKKVYLIKPAMDERFPDITTRAGLTKKADLEVETSLPFIPSVDCILVDEVQFLSPEIVDQLHDLSKKTPVICYGLRTNFKKELFPGSKRLLELADSIEEIKNTCHYCNSKSVFNSKQINGVKIYEGDSIELGAEELYLPVCKNHY